MSEGAAALPGTAPSEQVYTVKSGDSLTRIAGQFGLKVKALRAANSLKTDKIRVGQKLKIPAKSATTSATPSVGSAGGASNSTSTLSTAPGTR